MLLSSQGSRRFFLLVLATLIPGLAGLFDAPASAATMSVPSKLLFDVRETAGVARSGEVVRSGVPLPRSLNVLGTGGLAIVDASGTPVPAEFEVTARWNAGKSDATAPIQWLLVTFPATVGANQTATYRLVTDGSVANPAPATQLSLTQSGNVVTINTGAATFRLGGNPGALFDEVDLANGTQVIGGGALSVQTGGAAYGHSTTRSVTIEHQGPLTAIVAVQGAYDVPAVGGGAVQVNWRDNSSTEIQFVVESSLNGSTFQTAATVAANSTTTKITGLTPGVKYYFRVKAVDALGQASYTTAMYVTVR